MTKEGLSNVKVAEVLGVDEGTVRKDRRSENSEVPDADGALDGVAEESNSENSETDPPDLEAEAKTKTRKQRDLKAVAKREDKATREAKAVQSKSPDVGRFSVSVITPRWLNYSSADSDWTTPQGFFDAVDAEFGFDVDVCALGSSASRWVRGQRLTRDVLTPAEDQHVYRHRPVRDCGIRMPSTRELQRGRELAFPAWCRSTVALV